MSVPWRKIIHETQEHKKYVLAVSGGVDSMFGLDFFSRISGIDFCVAHFDHDIRADSNKDFPLIQEAVRKIPKNITIYFDKGSNISNEKEARDQRYDFLKKVKLDFGADYVVVFHHKDDQVETILLNLLRGRNHSKLGMKKLDTYLYRPFLDIPKETIKKMSLSREISWNEDSTNNENNYERNWLRNEIIPQLNVKRNTNAILNGLFK